MSNQPTVLSIPSNMKVFWQPVIKGWSLFQMNTTSMEVTFMQKLEEGEYTFVTDGSIVFLQALNLRQAKRHFKKAIEFAKKKQQQRENKLIIVQ